MALGGFHIGTRRLKFLYDLQIPVLSLSDMEYLAAICVVQLLCVQDPEIRAVHERYIIVSQQCGLAVLYCILFFYCEGR